MDTTKDCQAFRAIEATLAIRPLLRNFIQELLEATANDFMLTKSSNVAPVSHNTCRNSKFCGAPTFTRRLGPL